jgi:hypothetical protein
MSPRETEVDSGGLGHHYLTYAGHNAIERPFRSMCRWCIRIPLVCVDGAFTVDTPVLQRLRVTEAQNYHARLMDVLRPT